MKGTASFWTLYGFPILIVAASINTVLAVLGRPGSSTTDFLVFFQSSRQYLDGADPYLPFAAFRGPNLNPPWVVAVMAQFARMPLAIAVVTWWTIGAVCFVASMRFVADELPIGDTVTIASAVLVTQAAYANIRLGQVGFPLMLLLTAAWRADRTHRPILCGVLVGLAAAWKPFLLVFLPYFIWRRAWSILAAAIVAIGIAVAAGVAVVGASGYRSWLTVLQMVGWEGHPLNASLRGIVTRAFMRSDLVEQHTMPLIDAPAWRDASWLALSLAVAALTVIRVTYARSVDMAWASLGLLAVLISPLGWVHYVPIVTAPVAVIVRHQQWRVRGLAIAGWLLLCVPFAWLKSGAFGPLMSVTIVSVYSWGTLLLLTAVLSSEATERPDSASSSTPSPARTSVSI